MQANKYGGDFAVFFFQIEYVLHAMVDEIQWHRVCTYIHYFNAMRMMYSVIIEKEGVELRIENYVSSGNNSELNEGRLLPPFYL